MRLRAGLRVLRRTDTEVQVGTDPRWAVRLTDLTAAESDLLMSVQPRTDLSEPGRLRGGPRVDPQRARALVELLVDARLTDGRPPSAVLRGAAAVDADVWSLLRADGDGTRLVGARADRVVAVLGLRADGAGHRRGARRGGVGTLLLDDERPVRSTDVGVCGYRWSDAGSAREQVAARLLRDVAPHVSTVSDRRPDVVVLVEDGVVDPVRGPALVSGATAHLGVVVREADTVVGPLVVPGAGPCLRCLDLHRTDADDAWPTLASQARAGATPGEPGVTATVCAGLAAAAVLAYLDEPLGLQPGVTFEVSLPDAVPRRRVWAVHPECGCTALPASLVGAQGSFTAR